MICYFPDTLLSKSVTGGACYYYYTEGMLCVYSPALLLWLMLGGLYSKPYNLYFSMFYS
jgi:hypothetical protein